MQLHSAMQCSRVRDIVTTRQWCQPKLDVQPQPKPLTAVAAVTAAAVAATGSGSGRSNCSSRCPSARGTRQPAGSHTPCPTSSCVTTKQPCSAQQRAALNGTSAPFALAGASVKQAPPPPGPLGQWNPKQGPCNVVIPFPSPLSGGFVPRLQR